jgi:putative Holliday junction resolvase
MRIMAIDYGTKRVGIASTDETGHFALPRAVWPNDATLIEKVLELKDEEGDGKIIIGSSINLDGLANPIQAEILKFKSKLEERGVEVMLQTEIYTTVEARRLQGQTEMTDASAAALILKSYLDTVYNKAV